MHKLLHFGLQAEDRKGDLDELVGTHDGGASVAPARTEGTAARAAALELRGVLGQGYVKLQ